MTLKYIWRSFQPRLSFPRPFQQSLACFLVARSPSNSWACYLLLEWLVCAVYCTLMYIDLSVAAWRTQSMGVVCSVLQVIVSSTSGQSQLLDDANSWSLCRMSDECNVLLCSFTLCSSTLVLFCLLMYSTVIMCTLAYSSVHLLTYIPDTHCIVMTCFQCWH